jgi:2-iminobutanoate/2-iminopropanoate deaminase
MPDEPIAKEPIATPLAPAPVGPYSQAIRSGSILLVSGQVGVDPLTGAAAGDDVAAQTAQALANLFAIARAGGAAPQDALRLGVHLATMRLVTEFNEIYERLVPAPRPARTTVGSDLGGWLVEIDGMFAVHASD